MYQCKFAAKYLDVLKLILPQQCLWSPDGLPPAWAPLRPPSQAAPPLRKLVAVHFGSPDIFINISSYQTPLGRVSVYFLHGQISIGHFWHFKTLANAPTGALLWSASLRLQPHFGLKNGLAAQRSLVFFRWIIRCSDQHWQFTKHHNNHFDSLLVFDMDRPWRDPLWVRTESKSRASLVFQVGSEFFLLQDKYSLISGNVKRKGSRR